MSEEVVLRAVKAHIVANLQINSLAIGENNCDITIDGSPHQTPADFFIGVCSNGWSQPNTNSDPLNEIFSFKVVVTKRIVATPRREWAKILTEEATSLGKVVRDLMLLIDRNYTLMNEANTLLSLTHSFFRPPMFMNADPRPIERSESWWHTIHKPDRGPNPGPRGLSRALTFGDMERGQVRSGAT